VPMCLILVCVENNDFGPKCLDRPIYLSSAVITQLAYILAYNYSVSFEFVAI